MLNVKTQRFAVSASAYAIRSAGSFAQRKLV